MQNKSDTYWIENNIDVLLPSLSGETIGYYKESLDLIYEQMSSIENVYIEIEKQLSKEKKC